MNLRLRAHLIYFTLHSSTSMWQSISYVWSETSFLRSGQSFLFCFNHMELNYRFSNIAHQRGFDRTCCSDHIQSTGFVWYETRYHFLWLNVSHVSFSPVTSFINSVMLSFMMSFYFWSWVVEFWPSPFVDQEHCVLKVHGLDHVLKGSISTLGKLCHTDIFRRFRSRVFLPILYNFSSVHRDCMTRCFSKTLLAL